MVPDSNSQSNSRHLPSNKELSKRKHESNFHEEVYDGKKKKRTHSPSSLENSRDQLFHMRRMSTPPPHPQVPENIDGESPWKKYIVQSLR